MNSKMSKAFSKLSTDIKLNISDFDALMNLGMYQDPSKGGIYICIYLKDPRYVYIGRTVDFNTRWYKQHERQLQYNTHCGYFQKFFNDNNCSVDDFEWQILEPLPINDIKLMEAHEKAWIRKYDNDDNYILLNSQKYR
ncbi:MAG: GIY-YIG nuclease family protein [Clostridia bacterium]|nr:GIY-YIG nuclease family protein [Clostridia bacterium]